MKIFENIYDCCGCTACFNSCPTDAITMVNDEEGFKYPSIDDAKCIKCKKCIDVCPIKEYNFNTSSSPVAIFGAKHKDNDVRMRSRSGGAFTAVSDWILSKSGSVYGAGYSDFVVCHKRALCAMERDEFRGSKYVQSDLGRVFKDIKKDLSSGMHVLFTGTPCQTAGLQKYLGKNYNNLFLCDIVCYGVPSPKLFKLYLEYVAKKYKGNIQDINFRDKRLGWNTHIESFNISGKTVFSDDYSTLFSSNCALRPACSQCKFSKIQRPSDITFADFWGIDNAIKGFNDNKGVSLLLINSNKGKVLFDNIKLDLDYEQTSINKCMQPRLKKPTKVSKRRAVFWMDLNKKGIAFVIRKYKLIAKIARFKAKLSYRIKQTKKIVRKLNNV